MPKESSGGTKNEIVNLDQVVNQRNPEHRSWLFTRGAERRSICDRRPAVQASLLALTVALNLAFALFLGPFFC